MIRNPAETEVPIIPPILLKEPNFELIAEAVAATTMDVTTTMLVEKGLLELRKTAEGVEHKIRYQRWRASVR